MIFHGKGDYADEKKSRILNVKIVLGHLVIVKFITMDFMRCNEEGSDLSGPVIMGIGIWLILNKY